MTGATVRFLGPEWIELAHRRVREQTTQLDREHTVVFRHHDEDLGPTMHSQVWCGGRLRSWLPGATKHPDAVVDIELWAMFMWIFDRHVADAAIDVTDDAGDLWSLPPSPDQLSRIASSRVVKGLTFTAHVTCPDHPFGPRTQRYTFIDGVLVDGGSDEVTPMPRVDVALPFMHASSFLVGARPFRDIASESSIRGDLSLFANLVGLLAPPTSSRLAQSPDRAVSHASEVLFAIDLLRPSLQDLESRTIVP